MQTEARAAYVGLGSNLDDPVTQIETALDALADIEGATLTAHSSLYRSAPMGPADQPDYINAVAELSITLSAHALLQRLKEIEARQGRTRNGERWGPRTLDLDLLAVGDEQISDVTLTLPHPGIAVRSFVLLPWLEIAPECYIQGAGKVSELAERIATARDIHKLNEREDTPN